MAIRGFDKKDPMAGLNQLMQMMNQMNQMQDRRSRRYMNIYDEFSKSSESFNNEELQNNLGRMENYYNQNVDGMSAEDIDVHNMLKEKYTQQIKTNNEFSKDIDRRYSFSNDIMGFADKYSAVDESRDFSYKTTSIGNDGKMVEQDNIVSLPNPEDYEGGEKSLEWQKAHMKALEEIGGLNGYKQKKEEYKRYLKNEIQKQIGSYSDYMDTMVGKYGRSGRLNNLHLKDFAEIDESYGFIVDSLEDDGLFDEEEKSVYQSAIMQKSYRPIEQFIAKDQEIKSARRGLLLKDMQTLKKQGDEFSLHLDALIPASIATDGIDLKATGITLDKDNPYNTTGEIWNITNEEIKEAINNPSDANPELVNYIKSLQNNIELTKKELKSKDSSYMKNDGGSFLQGMEEETWTTGLHDDIQGYVPPVFNLDKKEQKTSKILNIENTEKSPPEYSISLDTSNKIEQSIGKILKPSEYDISIKTSNILNKNTGEKIDMVSYDKKNDVYTDSKGNKYPRDAIVVTSIDNISPKIKIANGKFYFFNPMTNKVEEWAGNKNNKNQTIEKISIDGRIRNVPKNKNNESYWIDGKWTNMRSIKKNRRKSK